MPSMMVRYLLVLVLVGLGLAVDASPVAKLYTKPNDERIPGQYIVVLKPQDKVDTFLRHLETSKPSIFTNSSVLNVFRNTINGFFAKLCPTAVQQFLEMEKVLYVEENGVVRVNQAPGSWGLDRVDQRYLPLDGTAEFTGDGSGVSAYILDTGIFPSNIYFGERAKVAYDAVGGGQEGIDCHGHGTHCAGTIGANTYGIATGAALFGVRVLNCAGFGATNQIVDGLEWVMNNGQKPAVASMSLGGGASQVFDDAVVAVIGSGIQVSVSAGNDYGDACTKSPARVPEAITVAATDITDTRAAFSNYGTCVDIFAPGVDITSTWIGADDATNTISGTSMSCPHVTGAAVIALGNDDSLDPADVKNKILNDATPGVVQDPETGSPNLMLYIP